mmetsp:Transcript_3429/g.4355  ORF Transcript_3429/g.4355 Transcript_3429/m.4355 type:complete len:208 (+) Transcript_3429:80-703(+)
MGRGVFVVLEGVDRSGKSTQCRRLVETLEKRGRSASLMRFPERATAIGNLINRYLKKEIELDDHAIHLLFSANRWELAVSIQDSVNAGTDVICDRYAYSGVAFSAAKSNIQDIEWCKAPDAGLPEPDLIIYLEFTHPQDAEKRGGYGDERYEDPQMQRRVAQNFKSLRSPRWKIVDAGRDPDDVARDILTILDQTILNLSPQLGSLW